MIAGHIEAINSRPETDARQLVLTLFRRSWPGGSPDRTEPVALDWLRRWGPRGASRPATPCTCASGLCAICN